jgi:hypothetical protein
MMDTLTEGWCSRCEKYSARLAEYPTLIGAWFCPRCTKECKKADHLEAD